MFSDLRSAARFLRIGRVLARHDALFPLALLGIPRPLLVLAGLGVPGRRDLRARRPGERLSLALQALGPSFIKLGQSLAVRDDLLGEAVAADLASLQDALPPFPTAQARAVIAAELGAPLDTLYRSFDDVPVAAASIAQVHFAVTAEGAPVAVKVLRPGIQARFAEDLAMFRWLARLIARHRPGLERLRAVEVVETFAETVALEMDLRMEAAAASELAENFRDDPDFQVPAVDWQRTGARVLTLQRVRGIRIDDVERLAAAGFDSRDVLARSAAVFFNQVFRDGFFHADMHPGNMFVSDPDGDAAEGEIPRGTLVPVDFGIMGRLDRPTRNFLADMLIAFLDRDYRRVAEIHFDAGYVPPNQSIDLFAQACRAIAEPILDRPMHEISVARLLGQLFTVTAAFRMPTQPQLLLLQKTMLVAEGVGRRLDPTTNMWLLARPLVEAWMRQHRGPEARIADAAGDWIGRLERLPALLDRAAAMEAAFTPQGLRLHPETAAALRDGSAESGAGGRWGWLVAGLGLGLALGLLFGL
ncbi:MAG: 2-polyprenylphenol 6-hydroxylase [Alphaproteobacteria bacterium]